MNISQCGWRIDWHCIAVFNASSPPSAEVSLPWTKFTEMRTLSIDYKCANFVSNFQQVCVKIWKFSSKTSFQFFTFVFISFNAEFFDFANSDELHFSSNWLRKISFSLNIFCTRLPIAILCCIYYYHSRECSYSTWRLPSTK